MLIEKSHFRIRPRDHYNMKLKTKKKINKSHLLFDDYLCNYCNYEVPKFDNIITHLRENHGDRSE